MKPILEINSNCVDKTDNYTFTNDDGEKVGISVCPSTSENYWTFRVKLCKDQAVLGFPKYGLCGIGMALEEDWNTNLPVFTDMSPEENAKRITRHIKCNKLYKSITNKMIEEAIELIAKAYISGKNS